LPIGTYSQNPNIRPTASNHDPASLPIGTYSQNPNIRPTASNYDPSCSRPSHEELENSPDMPDACDADEIIEPRNLSEQLNDYLENYVNITPDKQQAAITIVEEVEAELATVLETTNLPFDHFILTGMLLLLLKGFHKIWTFYEVLIC
jgi:hypothetical protein